MKTIKRIGLVALTALTVLITSCSGDEGGSGPSTSNLDTYVNATVAGVPFETFSIQGVSLGTASKDGSFVTVSGIAKASATSTDSKVITIALMNVTGTGTITLNANSNNGVLSYFDSATNKSWDSGNCDAGTATVNVTTLTATKIEGTFTFTGVNDDNCSDTKAVTNGTFRGTFMN